MCGAAGRGERVEHRVQEGANCGSSRISSAPFTAVGSRRAGRTIRISTSEVHVRQDHLPLDDVLAHRLVSRRAREFSDGRATEEGVRIGFRFAVRAVASGAGGGGGEERLEGVAAGEEEGEEDAL